MSTVPAVEGGSRRSSADAGGTMAGKQAKLRGERDAGCLLPAACCLLPAVLESRFVLTSYRGSWPSDLSINDCADCRDIKKNSQTHANAHLFFQ